MSLFFIIFESVFLKNSYENENIEEGGNWILE